MQVSTERVGVVGQVVESCGGLIDGGLGLCLICGEFLAAGRISEVAGIKLVTFIGSRDILNVVGGTPEADPA